MLIPGKHTGTAEIHFSHVHCLYRIETSNSTVARDGYGQELVATSINIKTSSMRNQLRPMSVEHGHRLVFEKGQNWGSKFVLFTKGVRDKRNCNAFSFWPVQNVKDAAVLGAYNYRWTYDSNPVERVLGQPILTTEPSFDDHLGSINTYDMSLFIKKTGLVAVQQCLKTR